MEQRYTIPGSDPHAIDGGNWLPVDADHLTSASIIIRRPKQAGDVSEKLLSGSMPQMSRDEVEKFISADAQDLAAVEKFVHGYGLEILSENAAARTVHISGSVMRVGQAFGVEIKWHVDADGHKCLSYQGTISVPENLAGIVEAVLGLDQRPVARRGVGA